ncbi:phosphodiesterase [uncultured Xylophilus sp.]|uniref:HD-GYP domain-containing protein n=1 Tax=uncultured Xylophilus sp. TaxID=296832 RepID=UPI0025DA6E4A|nr:phosphodiesterase [uncultured Xylophilus sp.]
MDPSSRAPAPPADDPSEDLLGQWSDLEAGLSMVLVQPLAVQDFALKLRQYDRWMRWLMEQDPDIALYMLFQLASTSSAGYSASHALVCAALCHLVAGELRLPAAERDVLVQAAMTMNIAMTELQDKLAQQNERLSAAQRQTVEGHAYEGALLLQRLGVADRLCLEVVRIHHSVGQSRRTRGWGALEPADRLAHVLNAIDRYAAMISPRVTRSGRSASESVRALLDGQGDYHEEMAQALLRAVGVWPPGTFVQLDSDEIAVVVRRTDDARTPAVAIVVDREGRALRQPRLHLTAQAPQVRAPIPRGRIETPLNNLRLLQVGVFARRHLERRAGAPR